MDMKFYLKATGIVLIGISALILLIYGCNKKATLIPNDGQLIVRHRLGGDVVIQPNHPDIKIPNYGHGSDTVVNKDGSIKVVARSFGVGYQPGLSLDSKGMGLALEFLYYKRLDLLGGVQFLDWPNVGETGTQLVCNPFIAIGYRIPVDEINNISLYGGINARQQLIAGLYLRFGNK